MSAPGGGGQVPKFSWNLQLPSDQLPLVISVFCGVALLVLLIFAIIMWRCCVAPHRNKDYRVKMSDTNSLPQRTVVPVLPSHSAVYLDPKSGEWSVSSRVVGCWRGASRHWFYNNSILNPAALDKCLVPRSVTVPTTHHRLPAHKAPYREYGGCARPHSQPSSLSPLPRERQASASLPPMSEFYPNANLCASSSILEESLNEMYCCHDGRSGLTKTQSLPACVRSKQRPVSTADDTAELYAKVNFSKKRKNRMRNDEAAIIALSKSGSQFLHKDTDVLVDNEAVVVYDERTAL